MVGVTLGAVIILSALWYLGLCQIVAWVADSRGRSQLGHFVIAFIWSPLIAILILIGLPAKEAAPEKEKQHSPEAKKGDWKNKYK